MTVVSVHEAKTNLSRLIEKVLAGEEVVIARNKQPVVRLVREGPPKKKPLLGALKGKISFDDSFFDPLPEDELNAWYDGKI
jgi:antitoxin (DNA-binding transcriptional repressor) of toxin-antitoxin stability system